MNADEVLNSAIFVAVDSVNEFLPPDKKLAKGTDVALVGASGGVDSLTLVSFIVALEQTVETKFGRTISLTDDEEFLTDTEGPLRSQGTLAEYLSGQLEN